MKSPREQPLILVVDGDAGQRWLTSAALRGAGFILLEAEDGEQALALAQSEQPDLVLLDVLVPGLGGFAVCKTLRRQPGGRDLPIIMVATLDDLASIERAYEAGATDFITKPVPWLALRHRIRHILRVSQTLRGLRESEERFRALARASDSAILVLDRQRRVLAVNPAAEKLYSFRRGERVGLDFMELLPPIDDWNGPSESPGCESTIQALDGNERALLYSNWMHATATQDIKIESLLREALTHQELTLHYQPQVDLDSGRIVGVEALPRWRNPLLGNVTPAEFIPLAEETGLIVPIGEWMLQTACTQARIWREIGLPSLRMAVNVSPRQFTDTELTQVIARILRETGLRPDYLELEITESLLAKDSVANTLRALKRLGVRLAIDDFGAGYSSLGHLRRLPIDRIKIAKSFVQDISGEDDDQAMAAAIIAMARSLRLGAIAEGVETEAQLAFLRALNCDEIQGSLFSQPHPAERAAALIRNHSKFPDLGLLWTNRAPLRPEERI